MQRLSYLARTKLSDFLEALAKRQVYVKLFGAVANGHIIDYELISGSRANLKRVAKKQRITVRVDICAALFLIDQDLREMYLWQATSSTFEVPHSATVAAEAEETNTGFYAEALPENAAKPECVSSKC